MYTTQVYIKTDIRWFLQTEIIIKLIRYIEVESLDTTLSIYYVFVRY